MVEPKNSLFCRLDDLTAIAQEQQRLEALLELGLLEAQTIPVFEEATQTIARSLNAPLCILGFLDQNSHWFKAAVGLSQLGLMNQLARYRQLPRQESFCTHVVESQQVLVINDTHVEPIFARSVLVQHYGIRAYLGAPLMDAAGNCLGAIAVMDKEPRCFEQREIELLELMARWCMSEFERNRLLRVQEADERRIWSTREKALLHPSRVPVSASPNALLPNSHAANQVKLELLGQLTQELRTPLTSVLGMTSVLGREIYGPLTTKQKEYLEVIQHSGRYLLSLVNELSELGTLYESSNALNLTSVDIEMLCQQAINTLEESAKRRDQNIRLSVEPGRRVWILDKDKVRQLLYHLIFSVIQVAATGSVIRIHVSNKAESLNLAIGVSHPWLGDGLTQIEPYLCQLPLAVASNYPEVVTYNNYPHHQEKLPTVPILADEPLDTSLQTSGAASVPRPNRSNHSRESLGLLLSCHLAELHGGQVSIQGTPESGYRYLVSLPYLSPVESNL